MTFFNNLPKNSIYLAKFPNNICFSNLHLNFLISIYPAKFITFYIYTYFIKLCHVNIFAKLYIQTRWRGMMARFAPLDPQLVGLSTSEYAGFTTSEQPGFTSNISIPTSIPNK